MIVGNISLLLLIAIAASYYFSFNKRPITAGLFCGLLILKPQTVFLIVPLLLLVPSISQNRKGKQESGWLNLQTYHRLAGFAVVVLIFAFYSFALLPNWLEYWFKAATKTTFNDSQSIDSEMISLRSLSEVIAPNTAAILPLALILSTPLWIGLALLWWRNRSNIEGYPFVLAIGITINVITAPYIRDYDSCVLLFPLLYCYFILKKRETIISSRFRASWLFWLLALLPFPIHFIAIAHQTTNAVELIIPSLIVCVVLIIWGETRQTGTALPHK
jgi:hypothetical protein